MAQEIWGTHHGTDLGSRPCEFAAGSLFQEGGVMYKYRKSDSFLTFATPSLQDCVLEDGSGEKMLS